MPFHAVGAWDSWEAGRIPLLHSSLAVLCTRGGRLHISDVEGGCVAIAYRRAASTQPVCNIVGCLTCHNRAINPPFPHASTSSHPHKTCLHPPSAMKHNFLLLYARGILHDMLTLGVRIYSALMVGNG